MTAARKLRINVIDDDPAVNLLLKTALSKLGHHVLTFTDPTECPCPAIKQATCSCPQEFPCADALISDIVMPNMSGIDFLKAQQARGCKIFKENKALFSATTDEEHFEAIEKLGCKFFKKPFKLVEIVKWLEECAEQLPDERDLAKSG